MGFAVVATTIPEPRRIGENHNIPREVPDDTEYRLSGAAMSTFSPGAKTVVEAPNMVSGATRPILSEAPTMIKERPSAHWCTISLSGTGASVWGSVFWLFPEDAATTAPSLVS